MAGHMFALYFGVVFGALVVAMPGDLWRDTKKVYTSVPNLIILGAITILVIFVAPRGIAGTIQNRYRFELLPIRRQ